MTAPPKVMSEHRCFDGVQRFYEFDSTVIGLPARFSVFLPPQAQQGPVPAVMYLAGLTCNEETFMTKAGAQRLASELGLALIAPDTSPRGANVPGESDSWDLGLGAGFYLDATAAPWSKSYRMESYLTTELLPLIKSFLPVDTARLGIFGHSMGCFAPCLHWRPSAHPASARGAKRRSPPISGPTNRLGPPTTPPR
jgi:S-formylglutathione hydrolase